MRIPRFPREWPFWLFWAAAAFMVVVGSVGVYRSGATADERTQAIAACRSRGGVPVYGIDGQVDCGPGAPLAGPR